ncbi:hypothetical protein ACFSFZ_15700 [Mixta tenebrionis]|jgi:hypothetical protein|uniref:Secreted protein n=2 Tax=Mixta TaxID=2100764 RepID=A0A6P1Q3K1_9GAMM|nr:MULTISPECIES: hypothetical protein [Mixta]QHM72629.1 hypothetical protein C7M51_02947 [Mixta intestinalis]
MKLKKYLFAMGCLLIAGPSLAGQAHVCHSQPVTNTAANAALTDKTVFNCGENLSGTIPELASKGWKIVQQTDQADMSNPARTYAQLIIQKD